MSDSTSNIAIQMRFLGRNAVRAGARGTASDLGIIERAGRSVNARLEAMGTRLDALMHRGQYVATALGVVAAAMGRLGAKTNETQDAQMVGFTALLKSRVKAQKMIKDIRAMAVASPILDPQSTGDAVRTLLAYGIAAKTVLPTVQALGDMSAASGRNFQEVMPLAAMALGQIQSKGRLQTQEMNQLAQSVGLSQNAIRKQLKMTKSDFAQTFTPGNNISAAKALPAIMRAMKAQSAGAADDLAKTTAGRISQAKELMALAAGDFTRPFYNAIGGVASRVSGVLTSMGTADPSRGRASRSQAAGFSTGLFTGKRSTRVHAGGKSSGRMVAKSNAGAQNAGAEVRRDLEKTVKFMQRVITIGRQAGTMLVNTLKPAVPFLKTVLLPLLKGIVVGVGGNVVGAFRGLMAITKPVFALLGALGIHVKSASSAFEFIGKVIGFVFGGEILKAMSALGKLGKVFKLLNLPLRILEGAFTGTFKVFQFFGAAFTRFVINPFTRFVVGPAKWIADKLRFAGAGMSFLLRGARAAAPGLGRLGALFRLLTAPIRAVVYLVKLFVGGQVKAAQALNKLTGLGGEVKAAFGLVGKAIGGVWTGIKAVVSWVEKLAGPLGKVLGLATKVAGLFGLGSDSVATLGTTNLNSVADALALGSVPTDVPVPGSGTSSGTKSSTKHSSSKSSSKVNSTVAHRKTTSAVIHLHNHNYVELDGKRVHESTATIERANLAWR